MDKEIQELWQDATPRPWKAVATPQGTFGKSWREIRAGNTSVISSASFTRHREELETYHGVQMSEDDAALIIAAVNHYDACLAERQRAVIAELVAALELMLNLGKTPFTVSQARAALAHTREQL